MNKFNLLVIAFITSINVSSQVGINTEDPKATLDVNAMANNTSVIDGFILPRLSGSQLQSKNSLYSSDQIGASVYVASASPAAGITGDKTINVTSPGYYYFDGSFWQPLHVNASNGLNKDNDLIKLGGAITQPTAITGITAANKLSFSGTGIDAINFDDNTLSIDASNNRVGVGIAVPAKSLDIEGTLRLSQSVSDNTPNRLMNSKPVYVTPSTGTVTYASDGFTSVSGGFRPGGNNVLIKTLPVTSTIARVRFVCYVNRSNEENNSASEAYTYGDLTLVGMDSSNPIQIVDTNIKGYNGQTRTLLTNTNTEIAWSNGTQGFTILTLDRSTGQLRIKNVDNFVNASRYITTMSYFFEFLGGI